MILSKVPGLISTQELIGEDDKSVRNARITQAGEGCVVILFFVHAQER